MHPDDFVSAAQHVETANIEKWLVRHAEHYPGPHEEIHPWNPMIGRIFVCSCKACVQFKWIVDNSESWTLKVTETTRG